MKPLWVWIVSLVRSHWIWRITILWLWWRGTPFKMGCRFQRICCLILRMPSSRKTNHISRNHPKSPISRSKVRRTSWSINWISQNSFLKNLKTPLPKTLRTCSEITATLRIIMFYIIEKLANICNPIWTP